MSDLETVIHAAQKQDPAAFAELVRRFSPLAVAYAFAWLGDFHRAQDVAQEAFLEAYLQLPRLQEPAAFPSLLRKLVVKHADRITRAKSHRRASLGAADAVPSASAAPSHAAEARESRRLLHDALAGLPQPQRIVLSLFYIRQRPLAEVATFLDVPVSTVKNRLHLARKTLQKRMLAMVANELVSHAPDENFTRRLTGAVDTFTAKGPPDGRMDSDWHRRVLAQIRQLAVRSEENFQIVCALARSPHAAARYAAATPLLFQRDPRGIDELRALMADPSAAVRRQALRAYAGSLETSPDGWVDIGTKAVAVPPGAASMLPLLSDPNLKTRYNALQFLGRYAHLGNPQIDAAVTELLADPTHKFHHAAALALETPCPSCKTIPPRRPVPPGEKSHAAD